MFACAVADKRHHLVRESLPAFFFNGKNVAQDLARMFVVGQGVDRWDPGEFGEFLDIALRKGANDRAVNHPARGPAPCL